MKKFSTFLIVFVFMLAGGIFTACDENEQYSISYEQSEAYSVSLNQITACEGDSIFVNIKINEGLAIEKVLANNTECSKVEEGVYTFSMPAENVKIKVNVKTTGLVDGSLEHSLEVKKITLYDEITGVMQNVDSFQPCIITNLDEGLAMPKYILQSGSYALTIDIVSTLNKNNYIVSMSTQQEGVDIVLVNNFIPKVNGNMTFVSQIIAEITIDTNITLDLSSITIKFTTN